VVWALNPTWDDSDCVGLTFDYAKPQLQATVVSGPDPPGRFTPISERRFRETLTTYSGVIDIREITRITGFCRWYAWTKGEDAEVLSIVLEEEMVDGRTVLCMINNDLEIHHDHADISISTNFLLDAERTGRLKEDYALMKASSSFNMDVFGHYRLSLWCELSYAASKCPLDATIISTNSGTRLDLADYPTV
jgi:hypothetical protein